MISKEITIFFPFIGLLAQKENRTGQRERHKLCIGDSQVCPGADTLPLFLEAFGQDDGGEIYVLGASILPIDAAAGTRLLIQSGTVIIIQGKSSVCKIYNRRWNLLAY